MVVDDFRLDKGIALFRFRVAVAYAEVGRVNRAGFGARGRRCNADVVQVDGRDLGNLLGLLADAVPGGGRFGTVDFVLQLDVEVIWVVLRRTHLAAVLEVDGQVHPPAGGQEAVEAEVGRQVIARRLEAVSFQYAVVQGAEANAAVVDGGGQVPQISQLDIRPGDGRYATAFV